MILDVVGELIVIADFLATPHSIRSTSLLKCTDYLLHRPVSIVRIILRFRSLRNVGVPFRTLELAGGFIIIIIIVSYYN